MQNETGIAVSSDVSYIGHCSWWPRVDAPVVTKNWPAGISTRLLALILHYGFIQLSPCIQVLASL